MSNGYPEPYYPRQSTLKKYLPTLIGVAALGAGAYLIYNWYKSVRCTASQIGLTRCTKDGQEQACAYWLMPELGIPLWQGTGVGCVPDGNAGERAWPPYQNQLETYNPSGYAEDLYETFIPAGYPGYGMHLSQGVLEGRRPWEGETRSY